MTELQRARKLVDQAVASARSAEERARRHKSFNEQAARTTTALRELEELARIGNLSARARDQLARKLETQGAPMTSAMILGSFVCQTAGVLRANMHAPRP